MQAPADEQKPCLICHEKSHLNCAVCKVISYCSIECQHTDWPLHKLLCKSQRQDKRPTEMHRRAILFPEDRASPQFMWVRSELKQSADDEPDFEWVDMAALLGTDNPLVERFPILRNIFRGRSLNNTLEVALRNKNHLNRCGRNKSVDQMTNGRCHWNGHILALRRKGMDRDPSHYDNMTVADLRDVVDYFRACGDLTFTGVPQVSGGKVKGVRINCKGDQESLGVEQYVAVDVPQDHPIFDIGSHLPDIPRRIELPVLTRAYPMNKAWANTSSGPTNQAVTFLQPSIDKRSSIFMQWAPEVYQHKVGSVLIVRPDGKDFSPHQCEALCEYCQTKLQPLLEERMDEQTHPEVLAQVRTKDAFESFFAEYRAGRIGDDPSWEAVTSPYLI